MRISLQLDMEDLKLNPKYISLTQNTRLYETQIPIIGLTGGIATGKSSASLELEKLGAKIICADKLIKYIYTKEETLEFIKKNFQSAIINNQVDFKALRSEVFSNPALKKELENYLYSHLPSAFKYHLAQFENPNFIIYDVPLLFENKLETKLDATLLIYAPRETQLKRVIERDNNDENLANKILDSQDSIESKRSKASFIIENTGSLEELTQKIQSLRGSLFL